MSEDDVKTIGETEISHTKKIKTANKQAALDSLAKHLGINAADKLDIGNKDGKPFRVSNELEPNVEKMNAEQRKLYIALCESMGLADGKDT